MERNINAAVKLYSGDKPVDLFVEHLDQHLNALNTIFSDIEQLFVNSGVQNFERLPSGIPERGTFAKLFSILNFILEAAKIQGFKWSQSKYQFVKNGGNFEIDVAMDENTYLILALRYKELYSGSSGGGGGSEVPYEIEGHLIQINTDKIDADYMNSRFDKYLIILRKAGVDPIQLQNTLDELHKSFASLTQEEQKYANIFIHDVQNGTINIVNGKSFREYITEYQYNAKNDQIKKIATILGLDEEKLRVLMNSNLNETNINQFGRFDELKNTVVREKAKVYFEKLEGKTIPPFKVNIKVQNLLQKFIIEGGFEIQEI
jgi:type I restriction enzyme R subunit